MEYANYRKIPTLVRDRKPFEGNTMRGAWARGWEGPGRLGPASALTFVEHMRQRPMYVVWSYKTPIAWWTEAHGWYIVREWFSVTTSKHQGKLYLIPQCVCDRPHPSCECPVHPTCQGEHMARA